MEYECCTFHKIVTSRTNRQNGFVKNFIGKLRDEFHSCGLFNCGAEFQSSLDDFLEQYNNRRPHLGNSGMTPPPPADTSSFLERLSPVASCPFHL